MSAFIESQERKQFLPFICMSIYTDCINILGSLSNEYCVRQSCMFLPKDVYCCTKLLSAYMVTRMGLSWGATIYSKCTVYNRKARGRRHTMLLCISAMTYAYITQIVDIFP